MWTQAYVGKFGHKNPPVLVAEYEHPGTFEEACDEFFDDNRFYDEESISLAGLFLYENERKAKSHERR